MAHFNIEDYETVEDRLVKFWHDHPEGRIWTSIEETNNDKTVIIFRCEVFFNTEDRSPKATGYAEETRNSTPVNKTSFVENCETSAIGRALANCGYAAKGSRPSREEMEKVQRGPAAPYAAPSPVVTSAQIVTLFPGAAVVASAPQAVIVPKNPGAPASPKQLGLIRSIINGKGMTDAEGIEYVGTVLQREITSMTDVLMGDASAVINALKSIPMTHTTPEKPF